MLRAFIFVLLGLFMLNGSIFSQNCPDLSGFIKIGGLKGHDYYLSESLLTWEEANLLAQQNGGYLVSINNQEENDFIRQRLANNMVFIGLNDKSEEGNLQWSNGEQITLNLSSKNTNNNDFAVMNFWNGFWEFGNKWEQRKFVLEMECGSSTPTNSMPIQVFIFAGQSNMSGGGNSSEIDPDLKIVPPNAQVKIHFYGNEYTDLSAGNFGPELEFIHEISKANPSQKYLFIKYAWGGTGMNQWLPGSFHYQTLKDKVYQALGSLNSDYELAAFLWMQGETDAFSPDESALYAPRLNTMISSLRNELGTPDMPVLIGQTDPPNACCVAAVQQAQMNFVENDAQARFTLTGGVARHWNDPIHYNTAGQIDLGHRFFASYQTMKPQGFTFKCPENKVKILGEGATSVNVSWEIGQFVSGCPTSPNVNVTQIHGMTSGSAFEIGDHIISYAAIDGCQNKDTCHFSVEVQAFSACPMEVEGFTKLGDFNGHTYFLSKNDLTWTSAQDFASENGGYLTTISTDDENEFLKGKLNNHMVFIGLNDLNNEGQMNWPNGEALNLNLSYKNNDINDFAVMNFWDGTWEMVNKWVAKRFVMELDCASVFNSPVSNSVFSKMSPVYPNPATNEISFVFDSDVDKMVTFSLFSESGYLLLAEKRHLPKGKSTVSIEIESLPKGRYTIKSIQNQNSIHFVKY